MNNLRFAVAYVAALLLFGCAWFGAETLLYGSSQSSIVDSLACAYIAYIAYKAAQLYDYDEEDEDE